MKQNYFVYNGKQYNTGEIVTIRFFNHKTKKMCNAKAIFLHYDTDKKEYVVEIYGNEHSYTEDRFYKSLCNLEDVHTSKEARAAPIHHTFADELNIDSLLIAWIWYIFVIAVAVIFYDRIVIWVLASVVFFNYRNQKLKEAGYK